MDICEDHFVVLLTEQNLYKTLKLGPELGVQHIPPFHSHHTYIGSRQDAVDIQ